jgi:hypothetical protein
MGTFRCTGYNSRRMPQRASCLHTGFFGTYPRPKTLNLITMSSLPTDVAANAQETELLTEFSRLLRAPLLNTMNKGLQGAAPVPSLRGVPAHAPPFTLSVTDERAQVVSAVPVHMAALDALKQFFSVPIQLSLAPWEWIAFGIGPGVPHRCTRCVHTGCASIRWRGSPG